MSPPGSHLPPTTSANLTPTNAEMREAMFAAAIRKCSLIREESQDDDDDDDLDDFDMDSNELKPSKSLELLDEWSNETSQGSNFEYGTLSKQCTTPPNSTSDTGTHNSRRQLKSVCSSPQLLNQIHEENESEDEDDFVPMKLSAPRGRYSHSGLHSPEILRKYDQRRRRRAAGQRGASCSSSDASDTDDTESRSRKDCKLKHKFIHRRDSSDHSSDTDGPSGGNNTGGTGRLNTSSCSKASNSGRNNNNNNNRRDNSGNDGGGGSNGGGGKSHQNSRNHNMNYKNILAQKGNVMNAHCYQKLDIFCRAIDSDYMHQKVDFEADLKNKLNQVDPSMKDNLTQVTSLDQNEDDQDLLSRDLQLLNLSQKLGLIKSMSSLKDNINLLYENENFKNTDNVPDNVENNRNASNILDCLANFVELNNERESLNEHNIPISSETVEFSQVAEYCECLMETKTHKVSVCQEQCKDEAILLSSAPSPCCHASPGAHEFTIKSTVCSVV